MADTEYLRRTIEPIVKNKGLELFDVIFQKESGRWFLKIFIDKLEGVVKLSECEEISSLVSECLDKNDILFERYHLEVSSPGLDRLLRNINDFTRFKHKLAKITLHEPLSLSDQSKHFSGRIKEVRDEIIILEDKQGRIINIPYKKIARAKLEPEI